MKRGVLIFAVLVMGLASVANSQEPAPQPQAAAEIKFESVPFLKVTGSFRKPRNIDIDRDQNVYVADRNNRRIEVFGL